MSEQQTNPTAVVNALTTFEKKLQHDQDPGHVKYMGARSVEDLTDPSSSGKAAVSKKASDASVSSEHSVVSLKVVNNVAEKPPNEIKVCIHT